MENEFGPVKYVFIPKIETVLKAEKPPTQRQSNQLNWFTKDDMTISNISKNDIRQDCPMPCVSLGFQRDGEINP